MKMAFKIGFTAEPEKKKERIADNGASRRLTKRTPKKSVVEVYFPARHLTCSYYNDAFDLQRGDIVFVEGKLEGLRGRVISVNHTFKIKLSDYKKVIGVAETQVSGEFFLAGSHLVALNSVILPFEQVITWFKAPTEDDGDTVFSDDEQPLNINDLSSLKTDRETFIGGDEYYADNRVVYIELNGNKARAIVNGSRPYVIEFYYDDGEISGLVCDCFHVGPCKHEIAALLQLRETLKTVETEYGDAYEPESLAIISKQAFFEYVIGSKRYGSIAVD